MVEKWILSGEKLIGKGHEKNGLPCQDSILTMDKNGVKVIALSDGCGSSPLAEVGSQITVETLAYVLTERFDEVFALSEREIKNLIVDEIIDKDIAYVNVSANRQKILDTIEKKAPLYDYLSTKYNNAKTPEQKTLCFLEALNATVQAVAIKGEKIIFIRLGDGMIGEIKNGELKITSSEDKLNGIESNRTYYPTYFVTTEENDPAWELFEVIKGNNASEYDLLFIVCDGVADNILCPDGNGQAIDPYYMDKILDKQNDLNSLLLSYKEGGEKDDLSIVMLKSREPSYENVVIREYDENGKTINNEKLVTKESLLQVDEIKDDDFNTLFASGTEVSVYSNEDKKPDSYDETDEHTEDELSESEFKKNSFSKETTAIIKEYILNATNDESYLSYFLEQTSIIKEHIENGGDGTFATIYDLIKEVVDEDDFILILKRASLLGLFTVDYAEKTISERGTK